MGYSFAMDTSFKRADQVKRFRSGNFFADGYRLVDSRVVGNHFWGLVETIATGKKYIWLGLMMGGGRNMGWGYKSMDEYCGPYHYDCPLSLLNKASELESDREYAINWREKVRAYHAAKKSKVKFTEGMIVTYGGNDYRLVEKRLDRRGWIVVDVNDGMRYRMSSQKLNTSTLKV
jgi:hypothetical protein